jgi:hypothetical protein
MIGGIKNCRWKVVEGYKRTPHGYDGPKVTTHKLQELLPHVLHKVNALYITQPQVVLEAWPRVIGEKMAPFTKAIRFVEGILHVSVKNSSLLSLLNTPHDKQSLVEGLKKLVPYAPIKNIQFRIG